MTTTTTTYGFSKPDHLSPSGWDTELNANFDTLDDLLDGTDTLLGPLKGSTTGPVLNGLQAALAGTPGQSGFPQVSAYGQIGLVQGTFASPVNAGAGAASPPQVNIQRYIKPNDDGTGTGSPGVFLASTRYGDGTSGQGDAHDYYNLFSIASSGATANIGGIGHSVIGAAFYGKALTGSNLARAFGSISYAQLASGSTNGRAIGLEIDAVNSVGTDAPDITSGSAAGMTIGLNVAAFGTKANSSAMLIQASGAASNWLQGLTFFPNSIIAGGYLLNALGLVGANIFRTSTVLMNVGSGTPEGSVTASPGSLYLNTAGGAGTTLYVKQSGSATNTGWVGK